MTWDSDTISHLKVMWEAKEPLPVIAAALGTTKGAVAGKARRLNLAAMTGAVRKPEGVRIRKRSLMRAPLKEPPVYRPPEPTLARREPPEPLSKPTLARLMAGR